jgi:hypothetical protein
MSPTRPSPRVLVVLAALCLSSGLVAVSPVAAQSTSTSSSVFVSNATHTPTTPAVGETFEVSATINNQPGAQNSFQVNEVAVEVPGRGPAGYSRARDLGTLAPGSSIEVALTATVEDPGWHQLRVIVYGQTSSGRAVRVTYPVTVQVVERQRPQLDLVAEDGVVGAESPVNVTVANGLGDSIRNLRLDLTGEGVRVDRPRRVRPALAGEHEANYTFDVTPARPGERRLTARLTYTDDSGQQRTVTEQLSYAVEPLERDVRLNVATDRGASTAVEVTVINLGNAPLEDVAVTGESGQASVSTALVDRIDARDMEAVRLNVTDLSAVGTEFTVRADYETAGERYETTRAIRGAFVPGRIDLTGIDVAQIGDGAVRITGTASNVGTTRVEAVTVRVVSTARVTPSNPGKEYFVGAIAASDFSSFSVNARVEGGNETTIPLEVSYLVDGERRNRTITATYDRIETPDRGGSGFPLVGLAVVLVVGVAGLVLWRRRRAD